jgi:flagellar biosynthesis/type III secretory pathway protein FliH
MNEKQTSDNDNWSFPDVDFDDTVIDELATFSEEFHFITGDLELTESNEPKLSAEVLAHQSAENEIHELKSSYENKLKIVNNLIERIQHSVAVIDTEIINMIQDIINKVSKKIIHREIQTDSDLITKMIDELKAIVPVQNSMINVCLSPYDYQQLCDDNQNPLLTMTQYESLAVGDIIIKTNTTEIRAILNDRIDQLLEVEHG